MSEVKGGLARATALGLIVSATTAGLSLVRSKVAAEYLGPEGLGITAVANQWVLLFSVFASIITGPALLTALSKATGRDATLKTFRTAQICIVVLHVFAFGMAVASERLIQTKTEVSSAFIAAATLTNMFTALSQASQARLIADNALKQLTVLSLITAALGTVCIAAFTVVAGIDGYFLGASIGALGGLLVSWRFTPETFRALKPTGDPLDTGFMRSALSLGATSLVANLAIQSAMTSLRVGLDNASGPAANGLFQAAWALNTLAFGAITGGLGNYAFPRFAKATTAEELGGEVRRTLRFVLVLAAPVALLGIALHDVALPLLLSDKFNGASSLVGLLICGDVFRAAAWATSGPLMYRGRLKSFLFLELLGAVMLGVVPRFFFERLGLAAIGLAYIVNAGLQLLLSSWLLSATEQVRFPRLEVGFGMAIGLASAGALVLQTHYSVARWPLMAAALVVVILVALRSRSPSPNHPKEHLS